LKNHLTASVLDHLPINLQDLNEAVTRNVISSLSGRREQEVTQPPMVERMQILAGIKK
jgi:hypothetical protein